MYTHPIHILHSLYTWCSVTKESIEWYNNLNSDGQTVYGIYISYPTTASFSSLVLMLTVLSFRFWGSIALSLRSAFVWTSFSTRASFSMRALFAGVVRGSRPFQAQTRLPDGSATEMSTTNASLTHRAAAGPIFKAGIRDEITSVGEAGSHSHTSLRKSAYCSHREPSGVGYIIALKSTWEWRTV